MLSKRNERRCQQLPESAPSFAELPSYHRVKRFVDFFVSAAALILLSPLIVLISLLVLIDLGSPVVFWQQRLGRGGTSFFLYKFRTLHPPYDRRGLPVSEDDRLSWIGRLLRDGRLDELPQLFNVLVGEMSLIGPRPFCPKISQRIANYDYWRVRELPVGLR